MRNAQFLFFMIALRFFCFYFHIPRRSLAGEIVEMKTNDTHDPPSSIFKGFEQLSAPINQTAMEYR